MYMDSFVKFGSATPFRTELKRRVENYFQQKHLRKRDNVRLYLKATFFLLWASGSYFILVFKVTHVWEAALALTSLALALTGIGFNIQHDGNHCGFSSKAWVNRLAGSTLDYFLGTSSFIWKQKHNILHHPFTNIPEVDDDVDVTFLIRLSQSQRRFWFHRFQHRYLWLLYGFVHLRYLYYDYPIIIMGKIGKKKIPRLKGWELVTFVLGKFTFLVFAFVIPSLLHPFWLVLVLYVAVSLGIGAVFSTVSQTAHMITETQHPDAKADVSTEWAIHQVKTTADYGTRNKLLTWYVGGLNHQVEHHLFTDIAHVHYPALARIVREMTEEYHLPYTVHRSFFSALKSHYNFLKLMGQPN